MKDFKTVTKYLHNLVYVGKEDYIECKKLRKKQFLELLSIIKEQYKQITHTTKKSCFKVGCFTLCEKNDYLILIYKAKDYNYYKYYTNFRDDVKNEVQEASGIQTLKDKFKKRVGISFNKAFGTINQSFKKCVPGLFHWDNPFYMRNGIFKCNSTGKLDLSSCFPACACGKLPDATQLKHVKGIVMPNAEYPFAFYINSGFCAEYDYENKVVKNTYNVFKSTYGSLWNNKERKYPVLIDNYTQEKEETVLMKASPYFIDPEMHEYYDIKQKYPKDSKERQEAKTILLKLIGQMEQNSKTGYKNNPYAHLAAIIKSRALFKMLDLIYEVGEDNVIQVIVDGIIYDNIDSKHHGDKEEFLGSVKEESYKDIIHIRGHNQYIIFDKESGETKDICHAGFDLDIGKDIKKWKKSPSKELRKTIKEKLKLTIEVLK